MLRGLVVLTALCAGVYAQGAGRGAKVPDDQRQLQKIRDLTRELRELTARSPSGIPRASEQKRILAEIAKVNHPQAVRVLVISAEEPECAAVREDIFRILAEMPGADEAAVGRLMLGHLALDDPIRGIAREYLLGQALRTRRDDVPLALFAMGTHEDKFLSLQVAGRIESRRTVEWALALARDRSWSPDASGLLSCGTIATSVERFEGPAAARILLLLAKDPRFTAADASRVRDATRTWHETDLRSYVSLTDLNSSDALKRQEAAAFFGVVGIEFARAPLVRVAFNRSEVPEVRAAAASALGGLRIAREDLAERLAKLATDPERIVREGAMEGLGRLNVMQALEALVSMVDGPFSGEARAALSRHTSLPPETGWKEWLRKGK
jgi:hypothetical protein